jgi:hypothetical protein
MENENNQKIKNESNIISWKISEKNNKKKTLKWYLLFGTIGLIMFIYAVTTGNLFFSIILVFAGFLLLTEKTEKQSFEIILSEQGVLVGKEFYFYNQLQDFFIIYRPEEGIKNLYIHFKRFSRPNLPDNEPKGFSWLIFLINFFRSRFSIPLEDMNPLLIRKNLLKYLKENTERTDIPLSERLSNLFRF